MKKISTLFLALALAYGGFAQTYYNWDFTTASSSTFPAGFVTWKLDGQSVSTTDFSAGGQTLLNAAGWALLTAAQNNGSGAAVTTSDFTVPSATCDRWLVTPPMTIPSGVSNVALKWVASSGDPNYPDKYEVKISTTDSNTSSFTSTPLTITENPYNTARILPLAGYAGQTIRIAFRDITTNGYLLFLNSISLVNLPSNAATISDLEIYEHNYLTKPVVINGQMTNTGFDTINSFNINYSINGATPVTAAITAARYAPQQSYSYKHPAAFSPATAGTYTISTWFSAINGSSVSSDTVSTKVFFYPQVSGLNKNVLVEEFTGAWCGYCPGGALAIHDLLDSVPGSIAVAIHHDDGPNAPDAMEISAGDQIVNALLTPPSGYPSAMVDRLYFFDQQSIPLGFYAYQTVPYTSIQDTAARFRLKQATPTNVSLSDKLYDSIANTLTVTVNANFLDSLTQGDYRLNLYVIEDSIITSGAGYDQHNYYSAAGDQYDNPNSPLNALPAVITNNGQVGGWSQNHVLRLLAGGAWGTPAVIPSAPSAGATYSTTYTVNIDSTWRKQFVSIIGVVQEYNTNVNLRTILNATESKLLDVNTGIKQTEQFNKLQLYPNPAATMAVVEMDIKQDALVNISIVNILGEIVTEPSSVLLNAGIHSVKMPVNTLSDGLYFVKIVANGQTSSLPLSISK